MTHSLMKGFIDVKAGDTPVVAVAIHDGHVVRAELADKPQINVCTGGMGPDRCQIVVKCFIESMKSFDFLGGLFSALANP